MRIQIWPKKIKDISVIKVALVVDDDLICQTVMKYSLLTLGYQVDNVTDVNLAIKKIHTKTYDLIIVDIDLLTGTTGINVIESARQNQLNLATPLLVCTSNIDNNEENYRNLGADGFLEKPCTVEDLENAIADCSLITTYEKKFNIQLIGLRERWRELDEKKTELSAMDYVGKLKIFFQEALKIIQEYHVWLEIYEQKDEMSIV